MSYTSERRAKRKERRATGSSWVTSFLDFLGDIVFFGLDIILLPFRAIGGIFRFLGELLDGFS